MLRLMPLEVFDGVLDWMELHMSAAVPAELATRLHRRALEPYGGALVKGMESNMDESYELYFRRAKFYLNFKPSTEAEHENSDYLDRDYGYIDEAPDELPDELRVVPEHFKADEVAEAKEREAIKQRTDERRKCIELGLALDKSNRAQAVHNLSDDQRVEFRAIELEADQDLYLVKKYQEQEVTTA